MKLKLAIFHYLLIIFKVEFAVRLSGGNTLNEGRLEVYYNDEWGTICQENSLWDIKEANAVCRGLGYGIASEATSGVVFGQGSGSIWDNPYQCNGTEVSLQQCNQGGWETPQYPEPCSDVVVICLESGKIYFVTRSNLGNILQYKHDIIWYIFIHITLDLVCADETNGYNGHGCQEYRRWCDSGAYSQDVYKLFRHACRKTCQLCTGKKQLC